MRVIAVVSLFSGIVSSCATDNARYIIVDGCPKRNPDYDTESDPTPDKCCEWEWEMGMPGPCDKNYTQGPSSAPSKVKAPIILSDAPSITPTVAPSIRPSVIPTASPSNKPSITPTRVISNTPSMRPTVVPSKSPSRVPTRSPSNVPSKVPSKTPSDSPSDSPSEYPTWIATSKEKCPISKFVPN